MWWHYTLGNVKERPFSPDLARCFRSAESVCRRRERRPRDGKYVRASLREMGGALIIYDAVTLKDVKRLPMKKPVGKYNVWNKITKSEGPVTELGIRRFCQDWLTKVTPWFLGLWCCFVKLLIFSLLLLVLQQARIWLMTPRETAGLGLGRRSFPPRGSSLCRIQSAGPSACHA